MTATVSEGVAARTLAGERHANSPEQPADWSPGTRVVFRFFFLLAALFSVVVLWTEVLTRLPIPMQADPKSSTAGDSVRIVLKRLDLSRLPLRRSR